MSNIPSAPAKFTSKSFSIYSVLDTNTSPLAQDY